MQPTEKTFGYCPMCMQNVEHTRTFSSKLYNFLDLLSLRFLKLFRVGPWYCYQCEKKSFYLMQVRRNVPSFDSMKLRSDFQLPSLEPPVELESEEIESIGNYLKSEHSLVMREKRSRKYSQKFRDASVKRVLAGGTTIRELKHELNVNEADLVDWIANLVNRKQEQIDELKQALEAVRDNLPERLQVLLQTSELETLDGEGTVVEGRISPR